MSIYSIYIMTIMNSIDDVLEMIAPYYINLIGGMHLLYAFAFVGIISDNSILIRFINIFIQMFIGIFLMLRYNPFRTQRFYKNDANIIFGSAAFLLFNLGLVQYFKSFIDKI